MIELNGALVFWSLFVSDGGSYTLQLEFRRATTGVLGSGANLVRQGEPNLARARKRFLLAPFSK